MSTPVLEKRQGRHPSREYASAHELDSTLASLVQDGLRAVVDGAMAFPGTVLIVVDTIPRVRRLVQICGCDDLPNLVFFPRGEQR